jgi:uncharacterized protein YuzE
VFEGGLDVDRVTSAFADAPNYDPVDLGGYEEYQCFDTGPGLFLHAVTDGRAIEIDRLRQNDVDRNELERVVDAGAGDAERIGDRHDGVAVVANRLEPRHFSTLRAVNPQREPEPANGVYAGVTASGASAEVRDEETHMRAYLTFRDEAALEAVDTGPWIEASQEAEGVSELDVESDGRVLTIELTSATERLFGN